MKSRTSGAVRVVSGITALLAVMVLLSCGPSEEASRPNFVLIVIDALRQDHVGCYGYQRPTSPVMDAIAAENLLFENTISHAPWTKTSFATMMTSLYPHQHGVTGWESVMPDSLVTLPEILRDEGYSTMAVVNMLGIAERFKVLDGVDIISAAAKTERNAVKSTDAAIDLIKESEGPFFIIIHYFDVHWPYRPPLEYIDLIRLPDDPDPLVLRRGRSRISPRQGSGRVVPDEGFAISEIMMYDGCIRLVDDNIARLMEFLEEAGLREETAVFITADHGEAFWEHGFGSHGYDLHEESIRIPMIVSYPARYASPGRITGQVGLVDLLPTMLDLAGIDDTRRREGASLDDLVTGGKRTPAAGSLLPGDLLLAESSLRKAPDSKCIRSNSLKAILEPTTMRFQLYDLESDPAETNDLWGAESAMGDSLAGLLTGIPGSRVNGWRLGLTGSESGASFRLEARVLDGGRLTTVERIVGGGEFSLEIAGDSTSFEATVRPDQQQIVLFDVSPVDARVRFDIGASGKRVPSTLFIGRSARCQLGRVVTLSSTEALGLSAAFETSRSELLPGAFIWWLPGERTQQAAEKTDLTDEEVKRLKSLGYIQ